MLAFSFLIFPLFGLYLNLSPPFVATENWICQVSTPYDTLETIYIDRFYVLLVLLGWEVGTRLTDELITIHTYLV